MASMPTDPPWELSGWSFPSVNHHIVVNCGGGNRGDDTPLAGKP